ncbi:MarR family winged helix-turn-helix transcriptional regulator [Dysgonomonas sp. 25]|uniref:MarR family winged helix-turn-helix transcriptional regulator n=1 Tax=Dysgonomonas sp. 25 TaxID=2302933 RepID=UPI0013D41F6B|nr:MarR family winged helix-turn-helix transcriptional regulator [Dysgonomonas sp. 25]NDV69504.1 MarR family transcriptional regulator [Dysgonomonas sp. 25]
MTDELRKICELAKEDEVSNLARKVLKLWQRVIHRCIDDLNVTVPQLELMGAIIQLKTDNIETTQIALSQETGIDPMTTSTIIRNLQKKKLITRKESKTDTRARIVELTKEGSDIMLKAATRIRTLHDEMIQNGVDREVMREQLSILYNNMKNIK